VIANGNISEIMALSSDAPAITKYFALNIAIALNITANRPNSE
jgi:hypothetical protein